MCLVSILNQWKLHGSINLSLYLSHHPIRERESFYRDLTVNRNIYFYWNYSVTRGGGPGVHIQEITTNCILSIINILNSKSIWWIRWLSFLFIFIFYFFFCYLYFSFPLIFSMKILPLIFDQFFLLWKLCIKF